MTETHKNDHVDVTVTKEPGCRVILDIFVSPKASQAAHKKAIKSINKEVSIPGFRKGKAPENVIVDKYGSHIDREWRELLVNVAFKEALTLTKTYPYNDKNVKPTLKEVSNEEGSKVVLEFESFPDIPEIDAKELQLQTVERDPVTPDEIEETLENIRLHHAEWEEITDRPVEEEDYVNIDITLMEEKPMPVAEKARFHVKEGKMGGWMRKLLIGAKPGDIVSGMSEKEEENDEKEFKPTQTEIKIHTILKGTLPELDEELAKKVGAPSLEELHERVEKDLNRQADDEVKEKMREQLRKLLVEKFPFDIPGSLVEQELKTQAENPQEPEELKRQVENAYRLHFISSKVARDAGIDVSQEDLMQEILREVYSNPELRGMMESHPEQVRERAYARLLTRKAQDHLIESAS